MVLPRNKYNHSSAFKSSCLPISAYKFVEKEQEAQYIAKVRWLKRAMAIKSKLGNLDNSAWASALDLSELDLAACLKQADLAKHELSLLGLRLALKLAKAYRGIYSYQEWLDFVHEGFLSFVEALDDYDPSKGTRLSTYAYSKIRARFVTLNRRADKCDDISEFNESQIYDYQIQSVYKADLDMVAEVRQALTALPKRQRTVLEKRFGFSGEPQCVRAIAEDFGVSCRTICNDQSAAMLTLLKNCNLESLAS